MEFYARGLFFNSRSTWFSICLKLLLSFMRIFSFKFWVGPDKIKFLVSTHSLLQ